MPWAKGRSGNPGGRPKGLERRVRELVDPEELVGILLAVARDSGAEPRDRIASCKVLLERGWGQPKQKIDLDVTADAQPAAIDWSKVPLEQRRQLLDAATQLGALAEEVPSDVTEH